MDKKLSPRILIGHSRLLFDTLLGQNRSHLIIHYDNIITDVQTNKVNSCRTACNVSNWSLFYAGHYLPACSCFTDCPCSRDSGPYGTVVYWWFDYTADQVLLFLRRNLLEEELNWGWFTLGLQCVQLHLKASSAACTRPLAQAGLLPASRNPLLHVGPQVVYHILPSDPQR